MCTVYMGQQTYTKTLKKRNSKFLSNFKVLEASTKSNIIINTQRSSIQTLVFVILLISNKLNDLNFSSQSICYFEAIEIAFIIFLFCIFSSSAIRSIEHIILIFVGLYEERISVFSNIIT